MGWAARRVEHVMDERFFRIRVDAGSPALRDRVSSAKKPAPRALARWSRILAAAVVAVFAALFAAPTEAQTTNATGKPAVSGPPQVGEILTAETGDIADTDGLGTFSYQWIRVNRNGGNATDIAGATGSTYTPEAADVGKKVKVKVSFTDGVGNAETVTSDAYPYPSRGFPEAQIVAAKTDCPTDSDRCAEMTVGYGESPTNYPYFFHYGYLPRYHAEGHWGTLSDNSISHGSATYTVERMRISKRNDGFDYLSIGFSGDFDAHPIPEGTVFNLGGATFMAGDGHASVSSDYTGYNYVDYQGLILVEGAKVAVSVKFPASATAATGRPSITGRPQVGEVLTVGTADIADTDGLGAFSYQWVRIDGVTATDIPGATGNTYTPEAADVGKRLKVKVSFTDGEGNAEEVISEAWPTTGYPKAVIVAAKTACPADSDWCAEMTVGYGEGARHRDYFYGFMPRYFNEKVWVEADGHWGALSNRALAYGNTSLKFLKIGIVEYFHNTFAYAGFTGGERVPDGTVFNYGGTTFTANSDNFFSHEINSSGYTFTYRSGFHLVEGAKMTVSVKFPTDSAAATGQPTIAGTARVGETLSVSTADIADTDGKTKAESDEAGYGYAYRWLRVDGETETETADATASSYTLTAEDEGKTVKVKVSFTDDAGNAEEVTSDAWPSDGSNIAATSEAGAVTELAASATATAVALTWTAPGGTVLGYLIEVSYDGGATWAAVEADTASTGTRYVHLLAMTAGETRHYRVSAIDDGGAGAASEPVQASATIAAAGLTATGLALQDTPDGMATIDLCWKPTGIASSNLRNAAYRMREVATSGPDGWSDEIWTSADKRAGAASCANGIGIRVTGNLVAGVRYAFQFRARYGTAWVLSDAAEATSVDTSRTLRTEVTAGDTGLSGDTLVPDTVCPAYDDPATAEDDAGTFTLNIGFTTVDPAFVFYEEVTGFDPADDLTLENATAELAGPSYDRELGYRVRITPTNWGEDVAVSVPAGAVTHKDLSIPNLASAEFRRKTSTATSCAPEENPAATVDHVEILDEGTSNHEWAAGERIRARLQFDERMTVSTAGGVPTVTLRLGGDAVEVQAPYSSVGSNGWIAFDHVVTAGQGPVRKVQLVADSLALNGGEIASVSGPAAALGHPGATKMLHPPPKPLLTATWTKLPTVHPGAGNTFVVRLQFSLPATVSARDLRNHAISATGGAVARTWRVKKSDGTRDDALWAVRVVPDSHLPLTLSLTADRACGEQGAICTVDGTPLSDAASVTISGSEAQISVADAEAQEAPGAELVFEVTLDRAVRHRVKVDYRTVDGTAVAGADYTAVNGTLLFERGVTSRTVSVPVLDDAHDEDSETMTLVLSDPWRGRIADGEAVGTITNTDLMPQAWLARFGRTVADQVIDAVAGRMSAPRGAGTEVTVAGQRVEAGAAVADLEDREAAARVAALTAWFRDAEEDAARSALETRGVTSRDLLTGSSFALTGGSAEGGFGAVWGRGALSRFDGREGALTLDGEVESALLGADFSRGRWAAGLAVGHSRAEGGYASPQGDGAVESTLTGVYPYGRYDVDDWLSLWGVVGFGTGSLTLTPEGMDPIETDMDLRMAAAGLRSVLVDAPADGGFELAVTSDAMAVETTSDEVRGSRGSLAASEAGVTRLRAGLEGRWRGIGSLEPSFEIGVRQDGGDAETGFGADIGAGLTWREPALGIEAGLDARGLLTHEDGGFRERGFAGSFAWDPDPASDLGPKLALRQTVGTSATGGVDALLRPDSAQGLLAVNDDEGDDLGTRRLEAELGYGLSTFGGRYTTTPAVGFGLTEADREYSHSWRLAEAKRPGLVFGLDVEAVRLERLAGDVGPEHRVVVGLGWRLESARRAGTSFEVRLEGARSDVANDDAGPKSLIGIRLRTIW